MFLVNTGNKWSQYNTNILPWEVIAKADCVLEVTCNASVVRKDRKGEIGVVTIQKTKRV